MRYVLAAILIWLGMPAFALDALKCRPAQFAGPGSAAAWHVTTTSYCATWTCGGVAQLSVLSGEPTVAMLTDWTALRKSNSASLFNAMRTKYVTGDACTNAALLAAWTTCKADLTADQIKQLCPGLK